MRDRRDRKLIASSSYIHRSAQLRYGRGQNFCNYPPWHQKSLIHYIELHSCLYSWGQHLHAGREPMGKQGGSSSMGHHISVEWMKEVLGRQQQSMEEMLETGSSPLSTEHTLHTPGTTSFRIGLRKDSKCGGGGGYIWSSKVKQWGAEMIT